LQEPRKPKPITLRDEGSFLIIDLGADKPEHTEIHLILVSFEDAIVQGIRTIAIDPQIMAQIKEACFHQPSKFQSKDDCQKAAEGILDKFSSTTLRAMLRR
jgi:hypothetical protein